MTIIFAVIEVKYTHRVINAILLSIGESISGTKVTERVFISYDREDIKVAKTLFLKLNEIPEIERWLDKVSLKPGLIWRPAMRKAIRESRYFVTLLLPMKDTDNRGGD